MSHQKQASTRKHNSKAVPILGAAGLSLSLASGISSANAATAADMMTRTTAVGHEIAFSEEELSDVSLATFHVFDSENARTFRHNIKLGGGGCGCGNG
jgi:hypothetical protein